MPYRPWNNVAHPATAAVIALAFTACSSSTDTTADAGPTTGTPAANAAFVAAGFDAVFGAKDASAIDTYFSPTFIRHNPYATSDGTGDMKAFVRSLPASFAYARHRVLASGDHVVVHSTYDGLFGPGIKTVGLDLVTLSGGKIVEHWDCLQADPGTYKSGHSMVDGATTPNDSADADATSHLTVGTGGLLDVFFLGNNPDHKQLTDFIAGTYLQHDPLVGDGLAGLAATFGQAPFNTVKFKAVQLTVAQGDFAYARSEMTWNDPSLTDSKDDPAVSCDLFRVENGLIAEHWDVLQTDPNSRGKTFDTLGKNAAGHTMFQ